MRSLRTALRQHRAVRAHRRDDRAVEHMIATAPTVEAAHEIASLAAHR